MARANFSKADLTTGMVVEYRNGKRRLVIKGYTDASIEDKDILLGGTSERWTKLDNFNDDLTHKSKECLDIVKVYYHDLVTNNCDFSNDSDVIWDRTAPIRMTLADVCDTLGYAVEIVDDDDDEDDDLYEDEY